MNEMLSAWAGILVVAGTAIVVTSLALVWIFFFRKNARRRQRRRRLHTGEQSQAGQTLAQIGGLPPLRENEKSPVPPAPRT